MDDWTLPKPRLALLLDHLAVVEDARQSWRVIRFPANHFGWTGLGHQ
jgi:hypothetical protein